MKLSESDRLSLLALIVAVVALIVSAWQLAQQLFATATDGKRFCQPSVMGIWARKTRLSWRWSQIRFETKYTTPEIRLTSGITNRSISANSTEDTAGNVGYMPRFAYRIPILGWLIEITNGPASDWMGWYGVTSNHTNVPLELQRTRRQDVKTDKFESPDIVSWPNLIKWIYANEIRCIKKVQPEQPTNGTQDIIADDCKLEQAEKGTYSTADIDDAPYAPITDEERRHGEARVIVRLVERSWDLIPPDVVRPLAKSTVGTMIVIAHRFGMSWIGDFNPNDGEMNAAGCGHTLTSERVRGLGLVLQYINHQESPNPSLANVPKESRRGVKAGEYLSPTKAADKLHCGIIPVDEAAVLKRQEDIRLIDAERTLDIKSFISKLEVASSESDLLRDKKHQNSHGAPTRAFKHGIEEAISLLCPIPVLPDSQARWITWPFRNLRQPYTPFRQRAGLEILRERLSEYMLASNKPAVKIMRSREGTILKYLSKSPLEYLDFLLKVSSYLHQQNKEQKHRHTSGPTHQKKHHDTQREVSNIYRQIHTIHKETSTVFANIPSPSSSDDDSTEDDEGESSRPFLLDLAGAQITLATSHGKAADEIARSEKNKVQTTDRDRSTHFVQELARLYVDDLEAKDSKDPKDPKDSKDSKGDKTISKDDRTIRKHLVRRRGYDFKDGEAPALWWTAVVRSACWWMSVRIRLPETQIPSYWYDSQTPVYIT